jgi:hypothetical protein
MPAARAQTRGRRPDQSRRPAMGTLTARYRGDRLGGDRPQRLVPLRIASRCLSRNGITQALRELLTNGLIEAAAPPRSPNRRYRLVQ